MEVDFGENQQSKVATKLVLEESSPDRETILESVFILCYAILESHQKSHFRP